VGAGGRAPQLDARAGLRGRLREVEMKPAAFEYHAPQTLDALLTLLAEQGEDAKILAGGQSLVPVMNFRLARPSHLFDLNRIAELAFLRVENQTLRIGALAPHAALHN